MTRIALLGCGTVGRRVAEILLTERELIAQRTGVDLELSRILVRDGKRERGIAGAPFTTRFEDILTDPDLELVIEVIGGIEAARHHVLRLLQRGVHVVTANKSLMAHHGQELRAAGRRSGAVLACEASVCAAVPVLSALRSLRGDRVRAIRGIINGTCNFILSTMSAQDCSLEESLVIAQRDGLAEPDPSADLSGRDAAEKLCVLADAIGIDVAPDQIRRAGIAAIGPDDLHQARQWGFDIKCMAELDGRGAYAGPALLPRGHQLCQVRGADNALLIDTERSGEIVLRGKGAGPDPTAAAIIGDVISVLRNGQRDSLDLPLHRRTLNAPVRDRSRFFVRIAVERSIRPAQLIDAFRACGVEIAQIECRAKYCAVITRWSDHDSICRAVELLCDGNNGHVFIGPIRCDEIAEAGIDSGHEGAAPQASELEVQFTGQESELATANAEAA